MGHLLYEGYLEPEIMARVARGGGLCSRHARRLDKVGLVGTIAVIHSRILPDIQRSFAERMRRGDASINIVLEPGYCIVCDQQHDFERREGFFLSLLLEGSGVGCYGSPAVLCMPHLLRFVDHLDHDQLKSVIAIHDNRLAQLRQRLDRARDECDDATVAAAADTAIRLVLGLPHRHAPPLADAAPAEFAGERDPIRRMRKYMAQPRACPVCLEVSEACLQWAGWLAAAAEESGDLTDVTPLCRHHVWQSRAVGGTALAYRLADVAIRETQARFAFAQRSIDAQPGGPRLLPERFRAIRGRRHRRADALTSLRQGRECLLCRRAHGARDRALQLIAALLQESSGRRAFERGYGLCLPHAARAFTLTNDPVANKIVAATMHARLAVLRWEIEEQLRRYAWTARPEGHGAEADAWRRATARFSGMVCENGP